MSVTAPLSSHPHLTPAFKEYLATRIVQRFRERQLDYAGLLLEPTLFRDLLSEALDDASQADLVPNDQKFGCGIALILDDEFYNDVRWRTRNKGWHLSY